MKSLALVLIFMTITWNCHGQSYPKNEIIASKEFIDFAKAHHDFFTYLKAPKYQTSELPPPVSLTDLPDNFMEKYKQQYQQYQREMKEILSANPQLKENSEAYRKLSHQKKLALFDPEILEAKAFLKLKYPKRLELGNQLKIKTIAFQKKYPNLPLAEVKKWIKEFNKDN